MHVQLIEHLILLYAAQIFTSEKLKAEDVDISSSKSDFRQFKSCFSAKCYEPFFSVDQSLKHITNKIIVGLKTLRFSGETQPPANS